MKLAEIDRSKTVTVKRVIKNVWQNEYVGLIKKNSSATVETRVVPGFVRTPSFPKGVYLTGTEDLTSAEVEKLAEELMLEDVKHLKNRNSVEFWENFEVMIPTDGLTLNLQNANDLLSYLLLMTKPYTAKSLDDVEKKNKSGAELILVMTDVEDEAIDLNTRAEIKIKAFGEFYKMQPSEMRDYLIFVGKEAYNMSDAVVKAKVYQELELDPKKFVAVIDNPYFMDIVNIAKATHFAILRKSGNMYFFGETMLGSDLQRTIEYLNTPKNDMIKIAINEQLARFIKFEDPRNLVKEIDKAKNAGRREVFEEFNLLDSKENPDPFATLPVDSETETQVKVDRRRKVQ